MSSGGAALDRADGLELRTCFCGHDDTLAAWIELACRISSGHRSHKRPEFEPSRPAG